MNYKIEDYAEQLKLVCDSCRYALKCEDKNKICLLKKQVFTLAKWKMKRREKVGVKNECN